MIFLQDKTHCYSLKNSKVHVVYRFKLYQCYGYLMPFTLIIILILGAFSLAIHQLVNRSQRLALQQGLSSQAYYAAESGAQYAMHQLYFNQTTRVQVDARCISVNGSNINFNATGLSQCTSSLTCSRTVNTGDTESYYTITSNGQCGAGVGLAERSVLVKGRM